MKQLEKWLVYSVLDVGVIQDTPNIPPVTPGPRKPIPTIVAEVHNIVPVDAKRAWDAVVAACKGT